MNLDLSFLMPLLAIVVSIGAAVFWNGQGGKGVKAEEYLFAIVRDSIVREKIASTQKHEIRKTMVRIEVLPGGRLRSSDLRARDRAEDIVSL